MKAEERAFLIIDDWDCVMRPGIYSNELDDLKDRVTQAIIDARHEAMADCEQACLRMEQDAVCPEQCAAIILAMMEKES